MSDPAPLALFSSAELSELLGTTVEAGRGSLIERVVWGMIRPRIRPVLDTAGDRPASVDPTLFAIALQLGAVLAENPALLRASTTGIDSTSYPDGVVGDLLRDLDAWATTESGGGGGTGVPSPRGTFPTSTPYPDPAFGYGSLYGRPYRGGASY